MLLRKLKPELLKIVEECNVADLYEAFEIFVSGLNTWPKIKAENGELEDLDIRNFSILSVEKHRIIFCASGDWQEAKKLGLYLTGEIFEIVVLAKEWIAEGLDEIQFDEYFENV